MSTPRLHLATCLVFDANGRSVTTNEPGDTAHRAPAFKLSRGATEVAWAIRDDVAFAGELAALARDEPPNGDFAAPPIHLDRYRALLGGDPTDPGPAFAFPGAIERPDGTVIVDDEAALAQHFRGWIPGEIAAGRAPVIAIAVDGAPVSVCFCARLTELAAEAGVETAHAFRRRGLAARVVAGWALAIRAMGREPLYSTSWTNHASLAVARKLGLVAYASNWGWP